MRSPATRGRTAAAAGAIVALLAVVILLWPQGAGGSTTYLVTRGASMKPAFSSGDLAVLRKSDSYRVGDVAAYRSLTLRRVVLHRVVAVEGQTYTFKGDANSFRDPEQVRRSDVVGKLALRVPKLGSALLWLTSPFNALLLVLLVTLAVSDRARLLETVRGRRPTAAPMPSPTPAPAAAELDDERVVAITDLRFPYELAIADVVDEAALMRLAEHYDRPVLYDEGNARLFVVESNMLFRCHLADEVPALSVVRPLVPVVAAEAEPAERAEPEFAEPAAQWDEPEQVGSDEDQAWVKREQVWSEVDQTWVERQELWSEAEQVWIERQQAWSEVDQSWGLRERIWSETDQIWVDRDERWLLDAGTWPDDVETEEAQPATQEPPASTRTVLPRPATRKRPRVRRRVPTPQGRDWAYDDGRYDDSRYDDYPADERQPELRLVR